MESPRGFRFGVFEADLQTGEVRKSGRKVKLQEQPFQVLVMLLKRAGDAVTREDVQKQLWPEDTFVDFEHGLNIAINKIREALGDSAENPRFVETLPKRGYRFIAPVVPLHSQATRQSPDVREVRIKIEDGLPATGPSGPGVTAAPKPARTWQKALLWGLSAVVPLSLAIGALLYLRPAPPRSVVRLNMAVTPAEQLRGLN